eukprot:6207719-Pleurochrysis_carterae.AAC.3
MVLAIGETVTMSRVPRVSITRAREGCLHLLMRRGCIAAPLPVRRNAVARIVAVSAISIVGAGFSISITIVSTSVCGAAASLRLRVGAVVRASPRPVRRAVLLATPRPRRLRAVALPTRRVLSLLLRLGVGRRLRLSRDASARAAALAPAALRLDARTTLVRPRRLALHVGVAPRAFAALAVDVGQFGLDAGGMGAAAATTPRERKQQLGQLRQQLRDSTRARETLRVKLAVIFPVRGKVWLE